ncbi:MAG: 2OG-Fe(II) oxygenase family protein, partial [Gammaproteobacteria bacterium]|nr:2OG-Fe(II) oxygenase family protein [Gammaproteobacteria bacterium]
MTGSGRPELRITPFWAVPFVEIHMPQPDRLLGELARLFLEREQSGDAARNPQKFDTQHGAVFESPFDLFYWSEEPVRELARFCHTAVASTVKQLNHYSEEQLAQLNFQYHAWFHVTRQGGYQAMHNHPNASWSGIFCVDAGEEVADRPDSGAVRFRSPHRSADMYTDEGNEHLVEQFAFAGRQVQHQAGRLLIFPSYLDHEVFPYLGERPRIVV